MKRNIITLLAVLSFHWTYACLWDYDTIEMERRQFPNTMELIAGKFLKHTPEFYYWRIQHRIAMLEKEPDKAALYDDLAVAYSKLGLNQQAIAVMKQKEEVAPHAYESYANLGTFYIHDGQLEKGLRFIEKAIEINPDAHFGREIYQKLLVEYLISKKKDGKTLLPLNNKLPSEPYAKMEEGGENFYLFLVKKGIIASTSRTYNPRATVPADVQKAIKGVEGMIRFGNHNSPVLLEALGDLLMQDGDYQAGRQLAARAYLKASYHVKSLEIQEAYRKKAIFALTLQHTKKGGEGFALEDMEDLFKEELMEAEAFYQKIRQDEHAWIVKGKNLDQEFSKKYYATPDLSLRKQWSSGHTAEQQYKRYRQDTGKSFSHEIRETAVYVDSVVKQFVDQQFGLAKPPVEHKTVDEEGTNLTFLLYLGTAFCLIFLIVLRVRFRSLSKEGRYDE